MDKCNLMESQAKKIGLLFSSYAAESKVESLPIDEGLLGALAGGAIGTGVGAIAGHAVGQSMADDANAQIAAGVDSGVEAGNKTLADEINKNVSQQTDELVSTVDAHAGQLRSEIAAGAEDANQIVRKSLDDVIPTPSAPSSTDNVLVRKAKEAGIAAAEKVKQPMLDKAAQTIDDIKQAAQQKADKFVSNVRAEIPSKLRSAGSKVTQAGQSGISAAGEELKSKVSKAVDSGIVYTATKLGAGAGGIAGAGVGYAATSSDDGKKRKDQHMSEDEDVIVSESRKVYNLFKRAIDEEQQASNAKKAGYAAGGAFLGTAMGGPLGGAAGAALGGAAGAAMTNTDGEGKAQQLGKAIGAGIGGAAGAAMTGGSLAGTAVGGAAGAMLGDTVGKLVGNKHTEPTPVKNPPKKNKQSSKASAPSPAPSPSPASKKTRSSRTRKTSSKKASKTPSSAATAVLQ